MGGAVSTTSVANLSRAHSTDVQRADELEVEVKCFSAASSQKRFSSFTIKPSGVVIQGSKSNVSLDIGQLYANATGQSLQRYELTDARACQLLVVSHLDSFWAVPAPEAFSRHSGTCRMLGDRNHTASTHQLGVGDVLRVGSVGLVVTELHDGEKLEALKDSTIDKLVRDTATIVDNDLNNVSDSGLKEARSDDTGTSEPIGDRMCYMCFDEEESEENPMISPCACTGDTQYVHLGCLRKWHKTGNESEVCAVTSVMASCSVCKTKYRSSIELPNGSNAQIFNSSLKPPYVSFLVVTRHEMARNLFNTRFQLSFASVLKSDGQNSSRDLTLGRSSTSDMMLDYRTVSAHHAVVKFKNGKFFFNDESSSNGSYLYLRKPVELRLGTTTNLRLGRSLLSLKVTQKSYRRLMRSMSAGISRRMSRSNSEDVGELGPNPDPTLNVDNLGNMIVPHSPSHFDLIHSLARPTATLAQSPSHASGQRSSPGYFQPDGLDEANNNNNNNNDDSDTPLGMFTPPSPLSHSHSPFSASPYASPATVGNLRPTDPLPRRPTLQLDQLDDPGQPFHMGSNDDGYSSSGGGGGGGDRGADSPMVFDTIRPQGGEGIPPNPQLFPDLLAKFDENSPLEEQRSPDKLNSDESPSPADSSNLAPITSNNSNISTNNLSSHDDSNSNDYNNSLDSLPPKSGKAVGQAEEIKRNSTRDSDNESGGTSGTSGSGGSKKMADDDMNGAITGLE
ncbi:hypothetical protein TrST_g2773 [Triparma strigata]|uniref:Uncharacterized protein n=1 Tax=Triparma strigata TaxID=1606541 RepID=A0A9W7BBY8_9STRA|nr:hypothetical protein TrST_g2773 [Triparma strigata]